MSKFCDKHGISEVRPYTLPETRQYVSGWQRELLSAVTADTSNAELVQLAHAIQRRGYEHGCGLQDVYTILYAKRDTARKAEEQEAMK